MKGKHLENYKTSGAELIMGSGRFVAPKTLEVLLNDGGTRVLAGDPGSNCRSPRPLQVPMTHTPTGDRLKPRSDDARRRRNHGLVHRWYRHS
jgi:hypothetical protein